MPSQVLSSIRRNPAKSGPTIGLALMGYLIAVIKGLDAIPFFVETPDVISAMERGW